MSVTSTNYSGENNTFLTPDVIAREALMILEGDIVAPQVMSTSAAADFTGSKVGDTIRVRRPAFFGVDDYSRTAGGSEAIKVQDANETSVDLKIEHHFDVSFEVSSKELTLSVDDFNGRLLQPAMSALAQKIDKYALSKIGDLGGFAFSTDYGSPDSLADMAAIVEKLNKQKVPQRNRKMIVSPAMQTQIYTITNFVQANLSGDATSPVKEAALGRFMGMDMMMALELPTHTAGAYVTAGTDMAVAINQGSSPAGYTEGTTTINLDGGDGSGTRALAIGDTLQITYADGIVRDHKVTTATASGSGAFASVGISPGLYGVDAAAVDQGSPAVVANDAVVTIVGGSGSVSSYTLGGAFVPEAFQLIFVPQPAPMGPGTSAATVSYNGMSLRVLQTFDHVKKRDLISVDAMVGCAAVDARLGARIASTDG
jgi:hypothetical protein